MGYVFFWLLFGLLISIIARNRGRDGCGWFVIGALMGPFGLLLAWILPKNEDMLDRQALATGRVKRCPHCAELIRTEAIVCRFCNREIPESVVIPELVQIPESSITEGTRDKRCGVCAYYQYHSLRGYRCELLGTTTKINHVCDNWMSVDGQDSPKGELDETAPIRKIACIGCRRLYENWRDYCPHCGRPHES